MVQNENNEVETKEVAPKGEVLTEVTSIAQEEERTGKKIEMPSAEELVARAASDIIVSQQQLNMLINQKNGGTKYNISRKGMNRVLNAILSLPEDEIPVRLQKKEEKIAFILGQKIIRDLFLLIQDDISKKIRAKREEEAAKANETKTEEVKPEGGNNEQ